MSFNNNKKWTEASLGEMLTFQRGFDITKKEQQPGSYQVISSSGPKSTHFEFKVKGPGVVIGRKGTLGSVFYSNESFWPHDTTLWVKDFHGNNEKFAYYFLQTMNLEQFDCGASNPTINRNHIHSLTVKFPQLLIQRKISSILSNYDDLIENNTRRIEILEQMAKLIYEEWFVRFRFPGHKNVKMISSELGEIPEGWEAKTLGELGKVITGKTPSTKNEKYYGDYIPFIKTPDMHGNVFCVSSSQCLSKIGEDSQKNKTLPENTLLVSCIGTVGVVSITSIESQTNQQINALILFDEERLEYLYFELKKLKTHLENLGANGATLTNVNKEKFQSIKVIDPDDNIVKSFHEFASPIFSQIKRLQLKNQNLRKTRDLLLLKLISGKIDVSDLDIHIKSEFQEL